MTTIYNRLLPAGLKKFIYNQFSISSSPPPITNSTFFPCKIGLLATIVSCALSGFAQNSLLVLSGKVRTQYSKGYELRAQTVQAMVTGAERFFEKKYPQYRFWAGLKILDKGDWQKLSYPMPYGMPHYRKFLVVAAEKKNGFFQDTTADSVISPYDAIAVHELGHYFMADLVKTDIYPNWANEFIATYFQNAYAVAKQMNINVPAQPGFMPAHRSLVDFEKGFPLIAHDYGWYQGQFMKLAQALYTRHRLKVLDAFIINYQPGGKQQQASELLHNLDPKIFDTWLLEMK